MGMEDSAIDGVGVLWGIFRRARREEEMGDDHSQC